MTSRIFRIGQIVPSSNITMETEIPAMLMGRQAIRPERFSFHSSRMRMKQVTKEELKAMDADSVRCAEELADAKVDVIGYACLVAIMSMGPGYHRTAEEKLAKIVAENGHSARVVSSAGALVGALQDLGAKRISIITPYMKPLTRLVVEYVESEGIEVQDAISLEVADNVAVGRLDPMALVDVYQRLDTRNADAVVLSACVQMPSLAAIPVVQAREERPVLSAAVATTYQILNAIGLEPVTPDAGWLLDLPSTSVGAARAVVEP